MRLITSVLVLVLFATWANAEEMKLPAPILRAEEKYNEALEKAKSNFLRAIDREIANLRLSDEDKNHAVKIVEAKDESIRAALLSVASDDVKFSLALVAKRKELVGNIDILGNSIKTKPEKPKGLTDTILDNTWSYGSWVVSFNKDGTENVNGKKDPNKSWVIKDGKVIVENKGNENQIWALQEDGSVLMTFETSKKTWKWVRVGKSD